MAISQDQFDRVIRDMPGFGRDPASVRKRIEAMEAVLEGLFVIPGTNRRVGLDSLVRLVPVVERPGHGGNGRVDRMGSAQPGHVEMATHAHGRQCRRRHAGGRDSLCRRHFRLSLQVEQQNLRIVRKHLDRHHPSTVTVEG